MTTSEQVPFRPVPPKRRNEQIRITVPLEVVEYLDHLADATADRRTEIAGDVLVRWYHEQIGAQS